MNKALKIIVIIILLVVVGGVIAAVKERTANVKEGCIMKIEAQQMIDEALEVDSQGGLSSSELIDECIKEAGYFF